MLVAKGKFDFTAEDLERAEKHIREATKEAMGSEEKMSTMLKTLAGKEGGLEIDPAIYDYAKKVTVKLLLGSAVLGVDPIQVILEAFLMGVEHGVAAEQTKPENTLNLNLMFGGQEGTA